MRQKSPDAIRRVEDLYLRVPPVEEGNTPASAQNQGYIYTAESIDPAYYNTEYSASILSKASKIKETGAAWAYEIVLQYTAKEGPTATNPGLYGSNLFKEGDFFTITSFNDNHDYIRGIIIDIIDISTTGPIADTYTYEYTLLCNINEGDPNQIEVNDNFVWKRRIFTDARNDSSFQKPINLLATQKTDGLYFRWEDPTDLAFKFNLRIREEYESDGSGITYFKVPGIKANGNNEISVSPFIGTTGSNFQKITSAKIANQGDVYSVNPSFTIIGTGTGASFNTLLDDSGSLRKDTYRIYETDYLTGTIKIISKNDVITPTIGLYVENLSEDVAIKTVTSINYGEFAITLIKTNGEDYSFSSTYGDSIIDNELKIHVGIKLLSGGNNYKKTATAIIKKYEEEDIYFIPNGVLSTGTYYWSVCSIFDENNKTYTEWTAERQLVVA
jgi:hypothetical protein